MLVLGSEDCASDRYRFREISTNVSSIDRALVCCINLDDPVTGLSGKRTGRFCGPVAEPAQRHGLITIRIQSGKFLRPCCGTA